MAVSFKVPASPKRSIFNIDSFLGVDMTNNGTSVDERMSPNAPNMIRDVPGKVRKRMGYKVEKDFGKGVIYGAHVLANTSTNTGDFVANRNMASLPTADLKVKGNSSVYIYSPVEIPVGVGTHISFTYITDKALNIHPYVTDYSDCDAELDMLNQSQAFHMAVGFEGDVKESYNAFEITNDTAGDATLKLSDIMVYINYDKDDALTEYRGFQTVQEKSLYAPAQNTYTYADSTDALSSSAASASSLFSVNTNNVTGLVHVEFDIAVEDLAGATFESLNVKYNCDQDSSGTTVTNLISTVDTSNANTIHISRVIDPAYDHDTYDVDTSKLVSVVVAVNVKDYTSWTANVKIRNFKMYGVTLKDNFYEEGGLTLIHIDNEIYKLDNGNYSLVSSDMNEHRSRSWQFENKLFIIDGQTYWVYDADTDTFASVYNSSYAKIPLMYISCNPEGDGTQYEDKNLLTDGFEQRFIVDSNHSTEANFQLIFSPLVQNSTVTVQVMKDNTGEMVTKEENVDYTVNRTTGVVTFLAGHLPGVTPLTGEDNVYITAYYSASAPMSKAECISKCTIGALFGINGATDRLFLSGNPDYPNVDWHSDQYDPGYIADTSYSKLGSDTSAIVGYTLVNNYLAAHKDENETEHNIIVREGDLVAIGETTKGDTTNYDEKPAFKIINTLQGPGAIAQDTFGYLQTEPLFLTRSGVFAITAQDITGEKYSQNRSFYVNGSLLEQNGLEDSFAITFNDMYFLFVNSKVYVLDGLQPIRTDKSEPYATRQYVCFYLTDIPARIAWVQNNTLYFGTTNGKICSVYKDIPSLSSYNDNGEAIKAWWETADLDGKLFYKNKAFRFIAVRLMSVLYTKVTLYSCRRGIWSKIKTKVFSNRVFSFSGIIFSQFTFNNDATDPVMTAKMRVRKIDKARFKIENLNLNEPFGIHDLAIEYVESGNYRG